MIKFDKSRFIFNKNIAVCLLIILGIVLRLRQYLFDRSLWIDEAMISLNLIQRSFSELFQKLDYNQGAPIGFLYVEKLLISLFGNSEYVLRLFPLICGIFSIFLFYNLVNKLFPQEISIFPLGLFCLLNPTIYYSSEVKQYSGDLLFTILILIIIVDFLEEKQLRKSKLIMYGFLLSISIWFSFAAIFVLFGGLIALSLYSFFEHRNLKGLSYIWFFSVLSFLLFYKLFLSNLDASEIRNFYSTEFLHFPPTGSELALFFRKLFYFGTFSENLFAKILFFIGVFSMVRSRRALILVLLSTLTLALLASSFYLYPLVVRFLLFLIPALLILIAEGAYFLYKFFRNNIIVFLVACFITLIPVVNLSFVVFRNPYKTEEIKPVLNYIKENKQNNDLIYIYYSAEYAYKYYAKRYGFNNDLIPEQSQYKYQAGLKRVYEKPGYNKIILGIRARNRNEEYINDINRLKGNKRVWFLFSHAYGQELPFFVNYLDSIGKRINSFSSIDAAAYLYDLKGDVL